MRSKFQKRSVLKLADRIILHKHGYNTPPLGAELGSRACPGFIPVIKKNFLQEFLIG
jgi:hypothetical protein